MFFPKSVRARIWIQICLTLKTIAFNYLPTASFMLHTLVVFYSLSIPLSFLTKKYPFLFGVTVHSQRYLFSQTFATRNAKVTQFQQWDLSRSCQVRLLGKFWKGQMKQVCFLGLLSFLSLHQCMDPGLDVQQLCCHNESWTMRMKPSHKV